MCANKKPPASISLQERDLSILRVFFESRLMTSAHVAAIFFDGKKEGAKKRLQKLKAEGFITERSRRAFEPSLLFLTPKGLSTLKERGVLREFPSLPSEAIQRRTRVSRTTLSHELEVMDVKTAFHAAIRSIEIFSVAEFTTWPSLNQFIASRPGRDAEEVLVKPDGFVRIHETEANDGLSEHTLFLELDRSTETLDTLVSRALCYLDYYKSGSFAVKNGASRSSYRDFPFRVLFVFKTAERRNNFAERLIRNLPPVLTNAWLSTQAEVMRDPLGAVWITPADYRTVFTDTSFEAEVRPLQAGYQRQTARDVMVERQVRKRRLLDQGVA
jgi:Replication-relaxation